MIYATCFFLDQFVHTVKRVESICLLLPMNQNGIWKLGRILLHIQNVVGKIEFLWILYIGESKNSIAVHFVKLSNFFDGCSKAIIVGKGTQQMSVVVIVHN